MKLLLAALTIALTAFPAVAQQPAPNTARMDQIASAYYEHKQFMGSVLVMRGDQALFEKSYGYANLEWDTPFTPDAKFRLGSLTKQFTAASIMLLQERGTLKTSDLISQHLPYTPAAWSKITIRNLLTHTSGIPNFTDVPDYMSRVALLPTTPAKLYLGFRDKPLDFQPGEKFSYSNSNYILLGMIVEEASGMTYADFIQKNLFGPLHMDDTGVDSNARILHHRVYGYSKAGDKIVNADYADMTVPYAAGALYSTTHDLATWNSALYGGKVLKPESLTEMTTPYKSNYAYGLGVKTVDGNKRIEHGGGIEGFTTYLLYVAGDKLSVVVLNNLESAAPGEIAADLASIAYGNNVVLPWERKAIQVAPGELSQFTGVYAITPAHRLTITVAGDHLEAQGAGQPPITLAAESATKFFSIEPDLEIEFFKNPEGKVDHLVLHQGGQELTGKKQ
jgi:CubicO group peptidase (beta-lactamase class C family)